MSLQKFFDNFDDSCEPAGFVNFGWSQKGRGCGDISFYMKDGKVYCGNEIMGREFIKRQLCEMVDKAIMDCPHRYDGDGAPEQAGIGVPKPEDNLDI